VITQIRLGISNVFLIKGIRPVLVDSGMPHEAPRIAKALAGEGVKMSDLSLVVHTHGHWDHCGSSWQLKAWTKVPLAIHSADADKMRRGSNGVLKPTCFTAWLS